VQVCKESLGEVLAFSEAAGQIFWQGWSSFSPEVTAAARTRLALSVGVLVQLGGWRWVWTTQVTPNDM
jgi:hypothetical protein